MSELLKSAAKLVFLLLAITSCVGFFIGKLDPKDFMVLAMAAFTFYFANKGDQSQVYLGK